MKRKNKKIEKIKNQIEGFLTSEEAKITKKDAINLSLKAAIFSSLFPRITRAITSHVSHSKHSSCHSSCHTSHSSHFKHGSFPCPFLMVWNGKKFVLENNILPQSENILRENLVVEDWYKIETTPWPKENKYIFRIVEFESEKSKFYDFELIKVIHPKDVEIGIINNKIVAFSKIFLPSLVESEENKNLTKYFLKEGGKFFFQGKAGDKLKIEFDNLENQKPKYLIFKAALRANRKKIQKVAKMLEGKTFSREKFSRLLLKIAGTALGGSVHFLSKKAMAKEFPPPPEKYSIIFKMIFREDFSKIVEIVHPRERLSLGIVDISEYLKKNTKKICFSLEWTATHNLSFFALAQSSKKNFEIETLKPISLIHSAEKNLTKEITLLPGQFIEISFPFNKEKIPSSHKISFIFKCKGYYVSLM